LKSFPAHFSKARIEDVKYQFLRDLPVTGAMQKKPYKQEILE
jgi:hypothetical protein